MTITPISTEAIAVSAARALIAASPTFAARVASYAPGDDFLDHIYALEADSKILGDLKLLRPFAVVGLGDVVYSALNPGCNQTHLVPAGGVAVVIVDTARFTDLTVDDQFDSYLDFLNFSGGVKDDMSNRFNGVNDAIGFASIETVEQADRSSFGDRRNDDFWSVVMKFNFDRGVGQ